MQPPVHAGGAFCGSLVPGGDFCPQAGAFLWKYGAGGDFCPQIGYLLWMRRGNSSRLSTQEALFVEVRCSEATFVHAGGAFCGSLVPGGDFVHKKGIFCGRGEEIAAVCPRRRCFLWKYGAGGTFVHK